MYVSKRNKRHSTVHPLYNLPLTTFKTNLKAYISHYCSTTTIHGVKYIGEKGRYLVEKIVWICIVTTVCSACIMFINKMYYKWKTSPVIVSFETKETPIFAIPFPAVTICPEIKINLDYFNFTEHVLKKMRGVDVTKREETLFDSVLLSCSMQDYYKEFYGIENSRNFMDENFYVDLLLAAGDLHCDNETTVQFLGKNADRLTALSITEEGVCYTFNMLPLHEILKYFDKSLSNKTKPDVNIRKWSLEEGYPQGDNLDSYPKRTFMSGLDGGLIIEGLCANHSQLDNFCQGGVQGFKIALHHPSELPSMDKHFIVPLDHVALVAIKPSMITVSKELLNYDPKIRRCYFAEEKYLSLYKVYTQKNCLVECLSNFTLKKCGCVSFWMPSLEGTRVCGPGKIDCVRKSKIDYLSYSNRNQKDVEQCECLPSCMSLSYEIETSQTYWNWRQVDELFKVLNLSGSIFEPDLFYFSKVAVYYKDLQFLTSRRHELYGVIDFFSNVGGFLGLFIGFSVISVIEIIHFLSLRIICNVKKYGKKFWSGKPDLMDD